MKTWQQFLAEMAMPESGLERTISENELNKAFEQGFMFVVREEYWEKDMIPNRNDTGIYYYLGNQEDVKLPLIKEKCLVAYNKIHALDTLGVDRKFVLKNLGYYRKSQKHTEEEYLNFFFKGQAKNRIWDHFDDCLAPLAKSKGYDTIILIKEPNTTRKGSATEIIDIRNVIP